MTFVIYRDRKKEFRWTLYARNGRKVADSAEGYKRRGQARRMIEKINVEPHKIEENEDHSHNRR